MTSPGSRLVEDVGEHQEAVRRAGEAHVGVQGSAIGRRRDAGRLGDGIRNSLCSGRENELCHLGRRDLASTSAAFTASTPILR